MQVIAGTHRSFTTHAIPTPFGWAALISLGVVGATQSRVMTAIVLVAALAVAAIGARIDVSEGRIPDAVVLGTVMPVAGIVAAELLAGGAVAPLTAVLLGALSLGGPLVVLHTIAPASLGFGDVKLGLALGSVVGLVDWRSGLLALCLASGLTALVGLARRANHLPFGPGLVAGAALALTATLATGGVVLPWR
jgi:leader peptidase (prepilin peptidase)/N-methyltransferase